MVETTDLASTWIQHRESLSFLIGNGLNRSAGRQYQDWKRLLLEVASEADIRFAPTLFDDTSVTYPEIFDFMVAHSAESERALRERVAAKVGAWTASPLHRTTIASLIVLGRPVLTPEFRHDIGTGVVHLQGPTATQPLLAAVSLCAKKSTCGERFLDLAHPRHLSVVKDDKPEPPGLHARSGLREAPLDREAPIAL